mgnify:CR=1 FL=1
MNARLDRLRELMAAAHCRAFLVTDLADVRYFCGFSGSNGALLVTGDSAALATDGRYRTQAAHQASDVEVDIERACGDHLLKQAFAAGARRVGFESAMSSITAVAVRF